jgi:predicted AlkP superfamily pyrophosphatase or phosphodiesterase
LKVHLSRLEPAMIERMIFLSIPGLRPGDVHDPGRTPTLHRLAEDGASCRLTPTFPCVTSCVQASMLTGAAPDQHGIIANGFFQPDRNEVEFWVAHHDAIQRPTFFTRLARERPDVTSAVWHAQNIKGAAANFIVTPSPIHEPDGTTRLWCYSKPDGLYQELLEDMGHFPLQHYWGPMAGIQSTRWIVEGALWLAERHAPHFQYVYIPHLDYAAQKFGPDSPEAAAALAELDAVLTEFIERHARLPHGAQTAWVLAGEYALTPVDGAIFPNRILREAGLLKVRRGPAGGGNATAEYLDMPASDAFAMVDHQFAHVYVQRGDPEAVAQIFARYDEIPDVIVGPERAAIGMDHDRSGQVILISQPNRWFAYYWWTDDGAAPPFARTVDIHAKPGYDPVELFIDMPARQIPLDASLVRGSHGAPAVAPHQQVLLISTHAELLEDLPLNPRDTDVYDLLCRAFGLS